MGIKKIILGEPMPDENDPKYKERAQRDRKAGEQFAHAVGLDRMAAFIQRFATNHNKIFLGIIFGFVLFSVGLNLYRMSRAVTYRPQPSSAVERQEQNLKFKRHHAPNSRNDSPLSPTQQNHTENKGIENSNQLQLEEYEAYR